MKVYSLLVLIFSLTCCAQNKYWLGKSYAFSRASLPGMVTAEERHRAPDTDYLAFVEVKPDVSIEWVEAYINNKTYRILSSKATEPIVAGLLEVSGDTVTISPAPGNTVYQLSLEPD